MAPRDMDVMVAAADAQDDLLDRRDEEMGFDLAKATAYQVAALYADVIAHDPKLAEMATEAWGRLPDDGMDLSDLIFGASLTLAEQDVSQVLRPDVRRALDAVSREAGIEATAAWAQGNPEAVARDATQKKAAR